MKEFIHRHAREAPLNASIPQTYPALVARAAQLFGQAPAIVTDSTRCSFTELEARVFQVARALLANGVRHGDRIALWAPNSPEWIYAALGATSIGAILVPMNTRLKGQEAAYILTSSGACHLFTVHDFLGTCYPDLIAAADLPLLKKITLLTGTHPRAQSWSDFLASSDLSAPAECTAAIAKVGPDDISDIMYTSGTTGKPKGVMASQQQSIRVFWTWSEWVGLEQADHYLIANPFFHTFGYKSGWLACLLRGATIFPMPVFDAAEALRLIAHHRITVLPGPPTIFHALLSHEKRATSDLSSLRLGITGAASVPAALIARMRTELGFKTVLTAYGLTESCGVLTICPHGTSDEKVAGTCGVAIPGIELRLVDDSGQIAEPGLPGEVLARGYNVMKGYFQDPTATALAIDADGWLHTGDIGVMDEQGFLKITDRKKDMFIVGGFNCYPAEIENLMSAHPAIAQVAVVGSADERLGEVGHAFVVLRPGASVDESTLTQWCRTNMANYKVPRRIEFVDSLPLNAAGKVQKFALREGHAR